MSRLSKLPQRLKTISTKIGSDIGTKRIRGYTLQQINKRIAERDNWTCQVCHTFTIHGEVDHKIPLSIGGKNTEENLQYLCSNCHDTKTEKEGKTSGYWGVYQSN